MNTPTLTPMFEQFHAAKRENPDCLLFFRMGDFYELFFDDAIEASRILGIALTSRNKDAEAPIPMAGVPVKSVDSYLTKLMRAGRRVAICEQVEDPREAKGLVKRAIVRVVTPGTLTEDEVLDQRRSNHLAAVHRHGDVCGLAWADLSTGAFEVTEVDLARLDGELSRLAPAEVLLAEIWNVGTDDDAPGDIEPGAEAAPLPGLEAKPRSFLARIREAGACPVFFLPDWTFGRERARADLCTHFGVHTLAGMDCEDLAAGLGAAGALLAYLARTQHGQLRHLRTLRRVRADRHMHLDRATQHALEIDRTLRGARGRGTLLDVLDVARTAMGSRLLATWLKSPLTDIAAIAQRHEAVLALHDADADRTRLRDLLGKVPDLERIAGRLGCERAGARDLVALGKGLAPVPAIARVLDTLSAPALTALVGAIDAQEELARDLTATLVDDPPIALKEGGLIRDGHDAELDRLRAIQRDGTAWMDRYQAELIVRTGIETLKVGYNRVFGYFIELSRGQAARAPAEFIRRQTLKNAERYVTPELKEFEDQVLSADEKIAALEHRIFCALRERAVAAVERILATARALATADVVASLAEVAREYRYVRPTVDDSRELDISLGRHPVLDRTVASFVPNDTHISAATPIHVLTGPNMAGKSTYVRQVALIVLLAQIGSFVPAGRARIGLVDRIFPRLGSADELARGNSTFMVEMIETASILNAATDRSLVALDEVGRGTSTFDGVAIAWALTEHLRSSVRARTLFATHYHELTDLARLHPEIANFQVAVREEGDRIAFLHRIVAGGTDKSYGIHVARLAGIPATVIARAQEILTRLERDAVDLSGAPAAHVLPPTAPGPAGPAPLPGPRVRRKQASLIFDLYDDTLDAVRNLRVDGMSPDEALEALRRLKAELDGREHVH